MANNSNLTPQEKKTRHAIDLPRHCDYDQNHQSPHASFAGTNCHRQYVPIVSGEDFFAEWHNGEQMAHKSAVVLRILTKANRAKVRDAKLRAYFL